MFHLLVFIYIYSVCVSISCSVMSDSFMTPWTAAHQAPLSIGFPRQEYWSGLPFPSPWALPNPGIELSLLHCRQILYHLSLQRSPFLKNKYLFSTYSTPSTKLDIGMKKKLVPALEELTEYLTQTDHKIHEFTPEITLG